MIRAVFRVSPCARMGGNPLREKAPMRALFHTCGFRGDPCGRLTEKRGRTHG